MSTLSTEGCMTLSPLGSLGRRGGDTLGALSPGGYPGRVHRRGSQGAPPTGGPPGGQSGGGPWGAPPGGCTLSEGI